MSTADEKIEALSAALLKPLRDVGSLLATEIDRLNAELAETRNDLRALDRAFRDRTDHLA